MSNRDYAYVVSLAAGGILAASLLFYLTVGRQIIQIPSCVIYEKTGFYCPACGGTRAVYALLQGDFLQSLWYHPVVIYSLAGYLFYLLTETAARLFTGFPILPVRFWKGFLYGGLLLLAVHTIGCNVLKFAFHILL